MDKKSRKIVKFYPTIKKPLSFNRLMDISKRIREAMGDMSQEELEKLSGVGQATVSRVLSEQSNPRLDTMMKIATALHKPLHYFYTEHDLIAKICLELSTLNDSELEDVLKYLLKEKLFKQKSA